MSGRDFDRDESPTCARLRRLVEAVDRFEVAWRAGDDPRIEDFLEGMDGSELERSRHELSRLASELGRLRPPPASAFTDTMLDETELCPARPAPGADSGMIGDFEPIEVIGRGGMGVVYRARQQGIGRIVALKVIRPEFGIEMVGEQFEAIVSRFRAEARAAGSIHHDNIVEVFAAGEDHGRYYYAMRLVEGRDLAALARDEPVASKRAARIIEAIARAIHHAHERGVLHRDLKPRNILVDADDRPFITDFGLAKILGEAQAGLTATGEMVGSPSYMAPEQVQTPGKVGPAADIYALGATLYDLIAGRPPFRAASAAETCRQVAELDPPRPRDLNPAIDRDLETIALKCLEKDPARRYASASDLADDLRRFLDGSPIRARPVGPVGRAFRWARRDPRTASLAAGCLAVAVGLAASWAWQVARERQHAEAAARLDRRHADELRASAEVVRRNLYDAEVRMASEAVDRSQFERARRLLDRQRPGPGQADLRGFEWWHLWRLSDRDLALRGHAGAIRDLTFSPDGSTLATAGADGTARLWDAATWTERVRLVGHARSVGCLAFSADGRALFTGADDGTIRRWDARTGREEVRLASGLGSVLSLAASPDGRTLAYFANNQPSGSDRIELIDARTGASKGALTGHSAVVWSLAFSPDGRRLASGSADRTARLWDLTTRTATRVLAGHAADVEGVAFSRDGSTLATRGLDGDLKTWDAAIGREVDPPVAAAPGPPATALAFSADGRTLALGSSAGEIRLRDPASPRDRATAGGHLGRVSALAFSPRSGLLASAGEDGVVRFWDPADGRAVPRPGAGAPAREILAREPLVDGPDCLAFSRDGRSVALRGLGGRIEVREADLRSVRFRLPKEPVLVRVLTFSADGRSLFATGDERPVWSWDAATGEPRTAFDLDPSPRIWWSAASTPDGRLIVAGNGTRGQPGQIVAWDAQTGRRLATLEGAHADYVRSVAASPDGRTLVSGGGDRLVKLWGLPGFEPRATLEGHDGPVFAVAYAPDGRTVASGSGDHTIRLWDPATGDLLATLRGHADPVHALAFSPDGRRLASGGGDGSIWIWDFTTRREIAQLAGHAKRVNGLAFAPDGESLLSVGFDGTTRVWRASPGEGVTPP